MLGRGRAYSESKENHTAPESLYAERRYQRPCRASNTISGYERCAGRHLNCERHRKQHGLHCDDTRSGESVPESRRNECNASRCAENDEQVLRGSKLRPEYEDQNRPTDEHGRCKSEKPERGSAENESSRHRPDLGDVTVDLRARDSGGGCRARLAVIRLELAIAHEETTRTGRTATA